MASILVILGGFAGLVLAVTALVLGAGPLAALAIWSGSGIATVGLSLITLSPHAAEPLTA